MSEPQASMPPPKPGEPVGRRRWFVVHTLAVVVWVGALAATAITGELAISIAGWVALALAGVAGLRGGVSLLAPRGSSLLMDPDPRKSGNAIDGYTASGPVGLVLWLAIGLGLGGAAWCAFTVLGTP